MTLAHSYATKRRPCPPRPRPSAPWSLAPGRAGSGNPAPSGATAPLSPPADPQLIYKKDQFFLYPCAIRTLKQDTFDISRTQGNPASPARRGVLLPASPSGSTRCIRRPPAWIARPWTGMTGTQKKWHDVTRASREVSPTRPGDRVGKRKGCRASLRVGRARTRSRAQR